MKKNAYALIILALSINMVVAGPSDHDHQDQGQHHDFQDHSSQHSSSQNKPHLHGAVEMMLALEGNKIEISMESPAANIVGFEHVAATPEQNRLIDQARETLASHHKLFSFVGASCQLDALKLDFSAVLENDHYEDHEHHHDSDHQTYSDHDTHSEISAHYQFQCEEGSHLTAISLGFLEQFSGIETISVMWVTDHHQGAVELAGKSNIVYLGQRL